jgi:hypothetical protein
MTGVYVLLKLVDTVWFLVRKVEPYYAKYKGILATNNMVQLKRYYGSATGSILYAVCTTPQVLKRG